MTSKILPWVHQFQEFQEVLWVPEDPGVQHFLFHQGNHAHPDKIWKEGVILKLLQTWNFCICATSLLLGKREELTLGPTAPGAPPSPGTPYRQIKWERKFEIITFKLSFVIIKVEQLMESFSPDHPVCHPLLVVHQVRADPKNKATMKKKKFEQLQDSNQKQCLNIVQHNSCFLLLITINTCNYELLCKLCLLYLEARRTRLSLFTSLSSRSLKEYTNGYIMVYIFFWY